MEPIEESDLDLELKFKSGGLTEGRNVEAVEFKIEKEQPVEISSAEKEVAYGKILSKVKSQNSATYQDDVSTDADEAVKKTDAESQIQHLVDVATQKGVTHAVKVAMHMEDNYVLDLFHDKLLSDELHDALLKKGLLKEI